MYLYKVLEDFFPDTCLLAGEVPEVENASPAYLAELVYLNLVNKG